MGARDPDKPEPALQHELAIERRSRQEAEEALRLGRQTLAFVAHELRNPLTTIAGWLQILHCEDNPVLREHAVEVLTRNVKALSRLVDALIDETRIAQDQLELTQEPTDVRPLLERVCEDARGIAALKRQRFECELRDPLGKLHCDPFRIQQAINNLVCNAIKFTPMHGVICFQAGVEDDRLQCLVRDSGPGIANENLNTIFEPFVRVNGAAHRGGLGLGLHIARQLIELHGGSIHAESEGLGRGSTFHLCLPVNGSAL